MEEAPYLKSADISWVLLNKYLFLQLVFQGECRVADTIFG